METWATREDDDVPISDPIDMPKDYASEMKGTSKATLHTLLNPGPIDGRDAMPKILAPCQDSSK